MTGWLGSDALQLDGCVARQTTLIWRNRVLSKRRYHLTKPVARPRTVGLRTSIASRSTCTRLYTYSARARVRVYISKSNPITGLNRPRGFQEVEVPRFQDNRHMKVARSSALRTGRFLPPGNIPGTHFC